MQSRESLKLETFQLTGQFQTEIKQYIVKQISNCRLPKNAIVSIDRTRFKLSGSSYKACLAEKYGDKMIFAKDY